jgi:hypothetical protein
LRSSSLKKPPEPLRRAVADCLSSSSVASTSQHGISSVTLTDAPRTLRVSVWFLLDLEVVDFLFEFFFFKFCFLFLAVNLRFMC